MLTSRIRRIVTTLNIPPSARLFHGKCVGGLTATPTAENDKADTAKHNNIFLSKDNFDRVYLSKSRSASEKRMSLFSQGGDTQV
jgi:hypothetical protein